DADSRGLPGDVWQKQDGQQQARWKTDSHQDRSFPGIHPSFTTEKTRGLGRGWPCPAFQRTKWGFRPTISTGFAKPLWRKVRKGEHVSGTDPDARHSRIPYLQTH